MLQVAACNAERGCGAAAVHKALVPAVSTKFQTGPYTALRLDVSSGPHHRRLPLTKSSITVSKKSPLVL